jgi:murein DD-endopeptidase MepM/ murein hydrolase activator NlpD
MPARSISILLGASLFLFSSISEARTIPRRGAVRKPRAFKIQVPFPCGTQVRVSCAYGCKAHKRTRARKSTNDRYALDLTRVEKGNGFNKPVVAVADGVVLRAGWARGGWAPYGKYVYIQHDFKDRRGQHYQSMYAHLHRVAVRPGQRVRKGMIIGSLGGSSRRRLHRYGPHLHFAMYRGARSTLGGGRALVPEPLGQYEDIRRGSVMEACGAPDTVLALFGVDADEIDETATGGLE